MPEIHKGGPLGSGFEASENHFWGGSGHPNFMSQFEYGKSFLDNLFTKRF